MENMKMMLLLGGIFLGFISIMGVAMVIMLKKTSQTGGTEVINDSDIKTAQEFLPFNDIKDGMIDLGNHEYRAIIECQSINYDLKTELEKEMIDASFQRFLDSLAFPITIHIQTKTIDNKKILKLLEEEMLETVREFNQLYDYANIYYGEMVKINETIGNSKQKKKYIIVPFAESASLTYSDDKEKYYESLKGMHLRCQTVIDGLSGMGIKTKVLTSVEIAEIIYSTYHRDNYSDIEEIISGDYMGLIIDGKNAVSNLNGEDRVLWALSECEQRLRTELQLQRNTPEEKEKISQLLGDLYTLKKSLTQ